MTFVSDPYVMEELAMAGIGLLTSGFSSSLFGIASYILSSLALYAVASRRGIRKAWLSWVPVLNVWILGCISDQYRYVVKGQVKSKRKILLVLNLLVAVLGLVISGLVVSTVTGLIFGAVKNGNQMVTDLLTGPVIGVVCLSLPLTGLAVAAAVVRYMALYDVYTSMDPGNNVLFLVLSIVFGVTEPFFLFFNRNKDEGMPPRKQPLVQEENRHQPESDL